MRAGVALTVKPGSVIHNASGSGRSATGAAIQKCRSYAAPWITVRPPTSGVRTGTWNGAMALDVL